MPKMHIDKSIILSASVEKVFGILTDYNHWSPWSPWMITEPGVKMTVAPDTKSYEWEGKRTGSGNMKITSEVKDKRVDMDLNFIKPWKSQAKVWFLVEETEGGTRVSWLMDSHLPFFMFFFKNMMVALIGMDFERGLLMLKDYAETGSVNSKLEFRGFGEFVGSQYVGIKTKTSMNEMSAAMMNDFTKLQGFIEQNPDLYTGLMFSQYHKFDFGSGKVEYTAGLGVKSIPERLPEGVLSGSLPACKTHTIRHIGPYQHLGNAWTTASMMVRGKEFKTIKGIHPFEIYINNPSNAGEKDLITDITFAAK